MLHPENEMSATAEQKVKDLRATWHLQAEEGNALWAVFSAAECTTPNDRTVIRLYTTAIMLFGRFTEFYTRRQIVPQ